MAARSQGQESAKKLFRHQTVHGAATSSSPVSMKYAAIRRRVKKRMGIAPAPRGVSP
jgi:hypothetical protein